MGDAEQVGDLVLQLRSAANGERQDSGPCTPSGLQARLLAARRAMAVLGMRQAGAVQQALQNASTCDDQAQAHGAKEW